MDVNSEFVAVQSSRRKQIREPPAIPFLWELRPGVAIKNWKPEKEVVQVHSQPPANNLTASVPFIWEERPGKPIPFLLMDPDHEFSESDYSNSDCDESMGSYRTGSRDDIESIGSSIVSMRKKAAPTLGELIMMSRKMSIRRRHAQMRNLSSVELMMKKRGMGCFNIPERVGGLTDWKMKIQPMLKLAS